jgi:hypothetical protein
MDHDRQSILVQSPVISEPEIEDVCNYNRKHRLKERIFRVNLIAVNEETDNLEYQNITSKSYLKSATCILRDPDRTPIPVMSASPYVLMHSVELMIFLIDEEFNCYLNITAHSRNIQEQSYIIPISLDTSTCIGQSKRNYETAFVSHFGPFSTSYVPMQRNKQRS